MRIRNTSQTLNTLRNFSTNQTALRKNLEKLSSGYKINRAGDDAAGLAVSESMRERIKGLDQGHNNINDGIEMINTADGAMGEITEILQRISKLSIQAHDGIYNDENLQDIQGEISELKNEILRITDSTEFNNIKVLKQPSDDALQEYTRETPTWLKDYTSSKLDYGNLDGYDLNGQTNYQDTGKFSSRTMTPELDDNIAGVIDFSGLTSKYDGTDPLTAGDLYKDIYDLMGTSIGMSCGTCTSVYYGIAFYGTAVDPVTNRTEEYLKESMTYGNGKPATESAIDLGELTIGEDSDQTIFEYMSELINTNADPTQVSEAAKTIANRIYSKTLTTLNELADREDHFNRILDLNTDGSTPAIGIYDERDNQSNKPEVEFNTTGFKLDKTGNIWIQCSSGKDDRFLLDFPYINLDVLGIKDFDISDRENQSSAEDIKHAIDMISGFRAQLGAQQNRLEHTRNNNEVMDENVTSSESRIRDTDIAKEKSKLDKNSILIQSAQSILGQIDKSTQGILQLLE